MEFSADLPEVKRIQQWWAKEGSASDLTSLSLGGDGLTDLKTVQTKPVPCTVELCGVIVAFRETFSFTSKEGRELVKREITIADDSATKLTVALWGKRAQQEDSLFEGNPIVCLKGVRVQEFNGGRSGSLLEQGSMIWKPETAEAQKIQLWWSQGGSSQSLTALSVEYGTGAPRAPTGSASNIAELRAAAENVTAQGDTFSIITRLALVQTKKQGEVQPLLYMACQEPKQSGSSLPCNKRVDAGGFCAACNRVGKSAPRLNLRCRFSDHSDSAWLTTFHEAAQKVLAKTAEEAQEMESGDGGRDALEAAIRGRYFQQPLQLTVRAKLDTYNGETRSNITCIDARPVQHGVHARVMLKSIKEMLASEA